MFSILHRRKERGFTLVEMAIVLGVSSVLFAGLWRLMSGGGQQLRDQAAANQHQQLLSAVKGFLASPDGQQYLANNGNVGAATAFAISLPTTAPDGNTNAACKATIPNAQLKTLCDFLPSGFSSTTVNSYNQTFRVGVSYPALPSAGAPPRTYSFMVLSSGGEIIPDTSGGRISSQIGGDGGFVYTNTSVCGAPTANWACGSFGAWSVLSSIFSLTSAGGHIASRSFVSADQVSTNPWLSRSYINGDGTLATNNNYNTMTTNLFMKTGVATGNHFFMGGSPNRMYMATNTAAGSGGSSLYMQGGSIYTSGGSVFLNGGCLSGSTGGCGGSGGGRIDNIAQAFIGPPGGATAALTVTGSLALQAVGDVYVQGTLRAVSFVYSSDKRLKDDIKPLENSLEKIGKIDPVSFTMKDGGKKSMGVIAQDLEKIYPNLVIEMKDGFKGVDYMGLIGPLVAAIKELKTDNDNLQKRLDDLAAEIKLLKKK
ncbi:MAG: tail fiber domain-containing protein [Alphaproteobacteria bacterium]|nr:tail fiber domain-containing protein [Alphaproteobacteria bacterium]